MPRRPTRAVKFKKNVVELGTESSTEETLPADLAETTQLYSRFEPLQPKINTAISRQRFNGHEKSVYGSYLRFFPHVNTI